MNEKLKNKKGFTLTELIIVIVIIGILAAVLIPSLSSYIKKAKVSKGEQNARNMTSLIVGEVLLNDKEFLMPDEIIELVGKSGYDLVSELDEYAYWYDTEHNTIKYVNIKDAILAPSASGNDGRSRIECLSESHPNWFYIDQTPNAIKNVIDTVNNLYTNAKKEVSGNATTEVNRDYYIKVLNQMDSNFKKAIDELGSMKLLNKSSNLKSTIQSYAESFSVERSVYYTEDGIFSNKILDKWTEASTSPVAGFTGGTDISTPEEFNTSEALSFEHGVIDEAGTGKLALGDSFANVAVIVESPILIPSTVTDVGSSFKTLIEGQILIVASNLASTENLGHPKGNVEVGNLASLNLITYNSLPYTLNYAKRAYRFVTGTVFVIDATKQLLVDTGSTTPDLEGVLWIYDSNASSNNWEPYKIYDNTGKVVKWSEITGDENTTEGATNDDTTKKYKLLTYKVTTADESGNSSPVYVEITENQLKNLTPSKIISNETSTTYDEMKKYTETVLLSTYLIPTVEVKDVNFSDFISGGKINGKISMSSVVSPYSVKFSGVMINANNVGYKLDNVGYITDVLYGVDQLKKVDDATGNDVYTMDGNTEAKITVNVPYTANKFVNFSNVTVKVEYKYVYYEYVNSKWLEEQTMRVQSGKKFYCVDSDSASTVTLTGNIYDGFTYSVTGINTYKANVEEKESQNCNQIEITKITITDNSNNDQVLFERYFR